jgi:hypothetical protein
MYWQGEIGDEAKKCLLNGIMKIFFFQLHTQRCAINYLRHADTETTVPTTVAREAECSKEVYFQNVLPLFPANT